MISLNHRIRKQAGFRMDKKTGEKRESILQMVYKVYSILQTMGIKSIKSVESSDQITLNAVFKYQDMVKYKNKAKVSQNYDFFQQLGSGSQGQVFRARCRTTGNLRAIKKINKFRNQKTIENLENEFNILKNIDHPCIVKMYEMYEEGIYVYIVTELCEGMELFQLILEDKVIGEELALPLFYEILTTLSFLHKNRIMHRDIKPQNIIVNELNKSVKLIDFGSAVKFEDSQLRKRKRIGTSYYIAPEVLKREYNQKCDVWSVGVILYILLSGSLPFKGQNDLDVLKAVENSQLEFPSHKWKNVSFAAKQLVKKMLERDVSQRPFAEELLQSTWIKSNFHKIWSTNQQKQKIINSHLTNMKKFQQLNSNPIQDGIFIFIVNFVQNKNDEKEFMDTFRALDTNRDGVISVEELKLGLQKYVKLNRVDCEVIAKKIFDKVDVNRSGSIDYSQFVMSASNIQLVVTQDNIDLAFNYMDDDGSGKLSVQQIRQKLGDSVTEEQYNNLLKQFDKNNDGQISRYQFRDMMKALVKKPSARRSTLNSATKNPSLPTISNKSSSTSKPSLNNFKQSSNIEFIKPSISKDVGLIKRPSTYKGTKK